MESRNSASAAASDRLASPISARARSRSSARFSGPEAVTTFRRSAASSDAERRSAGILSPDPIGIEEAVALPDQAVEVGEREHRFRPVGPVVRDHREPEPELGESHGGGVPVHAEEIPLEDAAFRRCSRAVARGHRGKLVQRAEQERTRAHRRVEDPEPAYGPPGRLIAVGQTPLRLRLRTRQPSGDQCRERLAQQLANQGRRGVIGAGRPALVGRHHPFEDPAEHVRGDATALTLRDGEVEALEEPVEGVAPQEVRDVAPQPSLEWVGLEEAAVEKRNRAEA